MGKILKQITVEEIPADCSEPVDPKALEQARAIVDSIKERGEKALLEWAVKFGEVTDGESYTLTKEELKAAYDTLPEEKRGVLDRVVRGIPLIRSALRVVDCEQPLREDFGIAASLWGLYTGRAHPKVCQIATGEHQRYGDRYSRRPCWADCGCGGMRRVLRPWRPIPPAVERDDDSHYSEGGWCAKRVGGEPSPRPSDSRCSACGRG